MNYLNIVCLADNTVRITDYADLWISQIPFPGFVLFNQPNQRNLINRRFRHFSLLRQILKSDAERCLPPHTMNFI